MEDRDFHACVRCMSRNTLRRCSGCGYCVLCSVDCERFYKVVNDGAAACAYHRASNLLRTTAALDEANMSEFVAGPRAVMGSTMPNVPADVAVPNLLQFVTAYIAATLNTLPLTVNSYFAATLVLKSNGVWTRGLMRLGHLPTTAATGTGGHGDDSGAQAQRDQLVMRLLGAAGRLAVAQTRSGATETRDSDGGHAFLLGHPVRLPSSVPSTGAGPPRPSRWGLQFDLILGQRIRDMDSVLLSCARYGGGFRAAVAVYKLKGSLHEETGYPIFTFPTKLTESGKQIDDFQMERRAKCEGLPPILHPDKAREALNMRPELECPPVRPTDAF